MSTPTQSYLFPDTNRILSRSEARAEYEKCMAKVSRMKFAADEPPRRERRKESHEPAEHRRP